MGYGINIIGTINKYEEALLFSSLYYYTRGHVIQYTRMVPEPLCRLQCKTSRESLPFPIFPVLSYIIIDFMNDHHITTILFIYHTFKLCYLYPIPHCTINFYTSHAYHTRSINLSCKISVHQLQSLLLT